MKLEELQSQIESIIGKALTGEEFTKIFNAMMDEKMQEFIKSDKVKSEMVLTWEDLQERQAEKKKKLTLSQWLGDIARMSKGHMPVFSKDVSKDFIGAKSAVSPQLLDALSPSQVTFSDDVTPDQRAQVLAQQKAMYTSASASGGYLIPTEESRVLVDLTSKWSVIPPLCRQVPMRTNTITFPTLSSGLTAYWIPEATSSSASTQATGQKQEADATFGQMTITTHVCAILCYVTNQLLDDSDPSIDSVLMNLFGSTLGSYFDLACLSGAGTATDPVTGLDNLITTNVYTAGASLDYDDIVDIIWSVYAQALGPGTSPIDMIGHPLAEKNLMKVKDQDGAYLYKRPTEAGRIPTIWGQPFRMDRNCSITLGATSDKTRIYAGDFGNHGYAGNSMDIVIKANPWGTGFPVNMTAFLAEFRRGFQVDSEVFFSYLDGIPT